MSSNRPHPLARNPVVQLPFAAADDFEIRINGTYVGLLVMHALGGVELDMWSPVLIWNWKTGIKVLVSICVSGSPKAHSVGLPKPDGRTRLRVYFHVSLRQIYHTRTHDATAGKWRVDGGRAHW